MTKTIKYFSEDKKQFIQMLFKEIEELGTGFHSFLTLEKGNGYFYTCSHPQWEKIYVEENIIEKDMINHLKNGGAFRDWVLWNNSPKSFDPWGLTQRRIETCQTIKSASLLFYEPERTHYFNLAFTQDADIEGFLWENKDLLSAYGHSLIKNLFQS